jgi:predicted transcriptional regulator
VEQKLQRPTDSELEILRVLWRRGASTVRDVHDELKDERGVGYTTTLKLLQIMAEKGLVTRNEDQRAHLYEAKAPQESTQQQLAGDLLDRVFGGSAAQMMMQALSAKRATPAEVAQIRRMLDQYEEKSK